MSPTGSVHTDPIEALWSRLSQPLDYEGTVEAMLGATRSAVALIRSAFLITSAETRDLLAAMPRLSRSLAVSTTDAPVRSINQVRGPILWSETMAARASSFGDEGLFVCSTTSRAYDTAENRVLVWALSVINDAARQVDTHRATGHHNEVAAEARRIDAASKRFLEHRTLSGIERKKPTGRELRRTRSGTRNRAYQPALALLERASVPFDPLDVADVAPPETMEWLSLLSRVMEAADARGIALGSLRAIDGVLVAGPVSFRHPDHKGALHHQPGILVGDRLLATAASGVAADIVDPSPADIDRALSMLP